MNQSSYQSLSFDEPKLSKSEDIKDPPSQLHPSSESFSFNLPSDIGFGRGTRLNNPNSYNSSNHNDLSGTYNNNNVQTNSNSSNNNNNNHPVGLGADGLGHGAGGLSTSLEEYVNGLIKDINSQIDETFVPLDRQLDDLDKELKNLQQSTNKILSDLDQWSSSVNSAAPTNPSSQLGSYNTNTSGTAHKPSPMPSSNYINASTIQPPSFFSTKDASVV